MFGGTDSYPPLEIGGHDYSPPPPFFTPPPNPYHPTYHSTYLPRKHPAVNSKLDWLKFSEAKKRGAVAKANAISEFKKRFLNADMSRFEVQVDFDANHKDTGEVYFRESKDSLADLLLTDRKHWTQAMKGALGMHQDGGFPFQLSLTKQNNPTKPIPAVNFSKKSTNKPLRCSEQRAKELCYTNRIFHHQVKADFQGYTDPSHNLKIRKKVAWWPPHELLATAAKLRSMVRNNRLWNFSRYTVLLRLYSGP